MNVGAMRLDEIEWENVSGYYYDYPWSCWVRGDEYSQDYIRIWKHKDEVHYWIAADRAYGNLGPLEAQCLLYHLLGVEDAVG